MNINEYFLIHIFLGKITNFYQQIYDKTKKNTYEKFKLCDKEDASLSVEEFSKIVYGIDGNIHNFYYSF